MVKETPLILPLLMLTSQVNTCQFFYGEVLCISTSKEVLRTLCWLKSSFPIASGKKKNYKKEKNTQEGVYQRLDASPKCWQTPKINTIIIYMIKHLNGVTL